MLENFVSKILVKALGDYIDDIDVDTLSLSMWRGNVELLDLKIKKSALDLFDIPVTIIDGHVGRIGVEIPWLSLATEPVRITISDIFLVLQPKKCVPWDHALEEQKAFEIKMKKLKHHEALNALTKSNESDKKEETTLEQDLVGKPTFVTRLVEKVMNNLQFKIENVHIRFEDNSDHERPIVAGFTLDSFDIASCDDNWNVTFVSEYHEMINKMLTVNTFSVYMNPDEEVLFSGVKDHEEFCKRMGDLISRKREENEYIIPQINSAIKIKMQRAGHIDLLKPKILADLFLDKVKFTLNETQWKNMLQTVEYVTNYEKYEKVIYSFIFFKICIVSIINAKG
jgi:vacuolar protein sorting-associated protein 13A/C